MKRLIAFVMILSLLIPAAAFADDPDPIIGCWYLYYNRSAAPEMESAFPGVDQVPGVYIFYDDGVIYELGIQLVGKTGEPSYVSCGKWEKSGSRYSVSIIGISQGDAILDGDSLFTQVQDNYYFKLHKLLPFSPFTDLVVK